MLCLFGKVYENVPAHNEIAVLWIGILQKVCLMELNLTLDLFRDPEGFTNLRKVLIQLLLRNINDGLVVIQPDLCLSDDGLVNIGGIDLYIPHGNKVGKRHNK